MIRRNLILTGIVLGVGLTGCSRHEKPNVTYMPDMAYSPALKAQEENAMRVPPKGTVPRGYQSYAYANTPGGAGAKLKNPLPRTKDVMARGQAMYNTYCIVCHGPNGEGDGTVVPKFPRPPSLQSGKIREMEDSGIYHIMTMGQNLMPSYAAQIPSADRWAIIHYIRALQRSKKPTPEDLKVVGN
jgi:mono/diheme cytochrome c family protein